MRICSYARPAPKTAKVDANGIFPAEAKPAATPIILASAIPVLKKRSLYSLANTEVFVDEDKSASKTTISGFIAPKRFSVSPYASRVAFPIIVPPMLL